MSSMIRMIAIYCFYILLWSLNPGGNDGHSSCLRVHVSIFKPQKCGFKLKCPFLVRISKEARGNQTSRLIISFLFWYASDSDFVKLKKISTNNETATLSRRNLDWYVNIQTPERSIKMKVELFDF